MRDGFSVTMSEISKNEEDALLGSDDSKLTLWKVHKKLIEIRPKGWINRFAHRVEDAELWDHPKSYEDARMDRMKASGWEPICKRLPTEPSRFTEDKVADIEQWNWQRSNLCYLCWGLVPMSPVRVTCLKCPIVAHSACVMDVRKYKLPVITSKRVNNDVQRHLNADQIAYDKNGVVTNWTCPFCIQAVDKRNNSCETKYQTDRRAYEEEYAAIKIQSFARMVKPKADYTRCIVGVLILQRMHRARRYWRKVEGEKVGAQLRPFRIRIHAVHVLVNVDRSPLNSVDANELNPLLAPYHYTIGEITANNYSDLMKSEEEDGDDSNGAAAADGTGSAAIFPSSSSVIPPLPHVPGANASSLVSEALSAFANATSAPSVGETEMLSLLRAGHIEAPSFLPPFKLSHGKLVTRGMYFLTIAVQKHSKTTDNVSYNLTNVAHFFLLVSFYIFVLLTGSSSP